MIKNKTQIAVLCFLSDVALGVWSYRKATNYDEYLKQIKIVTNSPEIQLQIYQMMLQWFTVALIAFLLFHLVIYFLFWKEKKAAVKYIRFYTLMAVVSGVLMIAASYYIAVLPTIIYGLSFVSAGRMQKA